jgi:hypothetical protein
MPEPIDAPPDPWATLFLMSQAMALMSENLRQIQEHLRQQAAIQQQVLGCLQEIARTMGYDDEDDAGGFSPEDN